MSDTHYLGEFQYLSAVWKMFPNGAGYGDYITIGGVRYDWDESTNSWGEDPGDVNPALPEIVNHDIDVQGTVIARDGIKTADYIPNEAGANIDHAGNAEFRTLKADTIRLQDPITGKLIPLAEFIKMFKTELPPDWTEYKQIPQFDDVRILAFDPISDEKFYTTIGALKKLIRDSITAGGVGTGTFDIEILRADEPDAIPTDNNVMSSLRTLMAIQSAVAPLAGKYLSRINDDTAQGLITFLKGISVEGLATFLDGLTSEGLATFLNGISVEELATLTQGLEIGEYTTGALGSGAAVKMVDGTSYAEVDNLTVRQKATFRELIIESLKHIGGQLVLTPARMKCVRVVDGDTFYKCYFDRGDGEVSNEFVAGDYARCQVFTGSGTKFYWRLVTLVGEDWINLSKTSAAVGSDAPEAGDDITQLGNATDTTRQSAIILSTVGIDAPSWKQYSGINSFSLEGKEITVFSKIGNRVYGDTVFTSGGANLDDYLDGVAQDILDALRAAQDAEDKAQQAIEDAEADVAIINTEIGRLQDQIDGKVSNWYYPYSPTLANYPASDWTTNEIKDSHIGDTFTNTETAPAENAGKSWRFVKNGSVYSWTLISDSDAIKALQEASKAQATADGKSTTYLFQPTKYKIGDMWVLNADQTVNGTLYKQGELLTATQDSETFVQSHWLKRVRYTDDTAVDELEIGGRNLVLNTETPFAGVSNDGGFGLIQETAYRFSKTLIVGETYTISFLAKATGSIRDFQPHISGSQQMGSFILSSDYVFYKNTFICQYSFINIHFYGVGVSTIDVKDFKIEKGNKATDWTPAPEDVQADIDTRVTTTVYDREMTQLENEISQRVTQTDFNALGQRVGTAEGTLTTQAGLIAAKAEASTVDALGSRVTTAESTIDAHTGEISSKVSQTDYDTNNTAINTKFSTIEQTATTISLRVEEAKSEAISTAADDATTKANTAKSEAISTAATYATDKVDGLKEDLSGTGIDIEEGKLTLYSGAKDGNAGGQVIIAGSNFSVGANGKIKAVDGEFSGKITATEGKIGGFDISGNELVNAATDARISFNGLDGGQSFIRLNTFSSMISIRTDVSNKTGLNIATYATGAVGLSIVSNAGSALAIRSVGGHFFYQRPSEVWSAPGVLAAVELQHPTQIVYHSWAVSGVSASNSAFTKDGNVVTWTHNLGHLNYVFLAASNAKDGSVTVGTKNSTNVQFTVYNHGANEEVHLLLIGRNKYVEI